MAHDDYCEPAASLIRKCGGALAVAKAIECHVTWVYRWRFPKNVPGGTGGRIPGSARERMLTASRDGRLPRIVPDDFELPEFRSTAAERAA